MTRKVNIAVVLPSAHVVEKFSALHDDARRRRRARPATSTRSPSSGSTRTGARHEALGSDVFEHKILAVRPAHDAGARNRDALLAFAGGDEDGHELAGARPREIAFDRKMNRDRLTAVGEARSA